MIFVHPQSPPSGSRTRPFDVVRQRCGPVGHVVGGSKYRVTVLRMVPRREGAKTDGEMDMDLMGPILVMAGITLFLLALTGTFGPIQ